MHLSSLLIFQALIFLLMVKMLMFSKTSHSIMFVYLLIPFCFQEKVFFLSKKHTSITSSGICLHQFLLLHDPNLSSAHSAQTSGILKFLPQNLSPPQASTLFCFLPAPNPSQSPVSHFSVLLPPQQPTFFLPCTTETAWAKITKDLLIKLSDDFLSALILFNLL